MNIICWNCRGLGSVEAVRQLNRIAKSCNPQIMFLSETKLSEREMEEVKWKVGYECGVFVGCDGQGRARRGGLALLWKRQIPVILMSFSANHIDVEIKENTNWRFTGIYGWPRTEERGYTWNLMRELKGKSNLPWLCGGDINEIMKNDEKRGGNAVHLNRLAAFGETAFYCNLREVPQSGLKFTWSNCRTGEDNIECKLDRYLANMDWWDIFPASRSEALPRIESDHSPILCRINKESPKPRASNRFRFEEMWSTHDELPQQIQMGWKGCPHGANFKDRTQHCANVLKIWEKQSFVMVRKQKKELDKAILVEQTSPLTEMSKAAINNLLQQREAIRGREEAMWAQRSRISWLKEGDRNTKFFHKTTTYRLQRNRIEGVKNDEGVLVKEEIEIQEIFRSYYVSLFSSSGSVQVESITNKVIPKVTLEMVEYLLTPYTKEEVYKALQQMQPSKAPGPDGLPPLFFQRYWDIVGEEVIQTTLEVLNENADPTVLNDTTIVLIPKVKSPTSCSEYRPISLCNVIMKMVTKTIANRMKLFLPDIIHENQSAFVPGRLIADNTLIAFEVYHYLKKKTSGKRGFCALKLDMMKAYDRVEWNFLEAMMLALGFPGHFVQLVMRCVNTVRYAVQINGTIGEYFSPSRGLRQGDPISPYLFLLCVEGLAALIRDAEDSGRIHGIRVGRSAPSVTHLFFADDSLFFARATETELNQVMELLLRYESASGQKINVQKSSLKFSRNVTETDKSRISTTLGIRLANEEEKYLGLPMFVGRSKKEVFTVLEERVTGKIENWRLRFLSKSGRETFIKSVLQAIPTYIMSCLSLPMDTCDRIEKKLGDVYWGSKEGEKKLHWRQWARLCKPKNEGGLGFRKLKCFNDAMLAKQAWRLLSEPQSLVARIFKARYYPRSKLLEAEIGYNPSYVWRSLLSGISLLKEGLEWRFGNGADIKIWQDSWLSGSPLGHPIYRYLGSDKFQHVSDLWCPDLLEWNDPLLQQLFSAEDISHIKSIRISPRSPPDILRWKHSDDGIYSVRSGYRRHFSIWWNSMQQADTRNIDSDVWKDGWKLRCPPRLLTFLWRILDNNLPVRVNLRKRGILEYTLCPLCNAHPESVEHLFISCNKTRRLLQNIDRNLILKDLPSFALAWKDYTQTRTNDEAGKLLAILWGVWKARNLCVFEELKQEDFPGIIANAIQYQDDYVAHVDRQHRLEPQQYIRWMPPPTGFIKVNTDAGLSNDEGGQVSAIARDDHGNFIRAAVKLIPEVKHPTLLEAYGIILGLELAKEIRATQVFIESDCQPLVLALQSRRRDRSDLATLVDDCLAATVAFDCVCFNFVRRSANTAAHLLAKMQRLSTDFLNFFTIPPESIVETLRQDVSVVV